MVKIGKRLPPPDLRCYRNPRRRARTSLPYLARRQAPRNFHFYATTGDSMKLTAPLVRNAEELEGPLPGMKPSGGS